MLLWDVICLGRILCVCLPPLLPTSSIFPTTIPVGHGCPTLSSATSGGVEDLGLHVYLEELIIRKHSI
jgi:hypothetical protein